MEEGRQKKQKQERQKKQEKKMMKIGTVIESKIENNSNQQKK